MCRWLAYSGSRIALHLLLFGPRNSLIRQSLHAQRSIVPTNGDGFGVGWYGDYEEPGVYRDTLPAWNDQNLHSLARQIRPKLFFAHVRASTGTATSRDNCHPFRHGNALFMHNGRIGGYADLRRDIEQRIPSPLYRHRFGTTDTEAFFLLALAHGLKDDPAAALAAAVRDIQDLMNATGTDEPLRIACAFTQGQDIVALRYSSDGQSPTLFHAAGGDVFLRDGEISFHTGEGSVIVLSEPLDEGALDWREVGESRLLIAGRGAVEERAFAPAAHR